MSYSPSIRFRPLAAVSAVVVLLSFDASAAAPERAASRSARAQIVRVSVPAQPVEAQEHVGDSEIRFSRPILRVGQDFTLGQNETVREIQSGLADITVAGHVEDDVVAIVGSLRLASTARVDGSVIVLGGPLVIEPGASVERDMVVLGGSLDTPPGFAPGGQQVVVGSIAVANTLHALVPWLTRGLLLGRPLVQDIAWMWAVVAIFFFIYLMVSALFANPVGAVANTVSSRPLSSFLLGLLVLLLAIPAIAILAATLIGIAVVPFVLCALVVGGLVGKAGVMRAIGRSVFPEDEDAGRARAIVSLVIGFAVLTIAYMIPVLGFITWALAGAIGLGGAATAFRASLRREQPPRVRPAPVEAVAATPDPRPVVVAEPAYAAPIGSFSPDAAVAAESAAAGSVPPPPAAAGPTDLTVYPRGTFLDRVAAFALDAVLVAIAVNLLNLTRHDGWFPMLLLAYHIAFWAWRGTTLGGIIVGLRVIRVQGNDLRFADALVRGLTGVFSIAALGIGCFTMIQDPEKQMWHDKIAGTLVVKVPRHLVLP